MFAIFAYVYRENHNNHLEKQQKETNSSERENFVSDFVLMAFVGNDGGGDDDDDGGGGLILTS